MLLTASFLLSFTKLLVAHALSDHFLQFPRWVKDKQERKLAATGLYWHILLTFAIAWLLSGSWQAALFIAITHAAIDSLKLLSGRTDALMLLLDQLAHVIVLLTAAYLFRSSVALWPNGLTVASSLPFWLLTAALLYLSYPTNVVQSSLQKPYFRRLKWDYMTKARFNHPRGQLNLIERLLFLGLFYLQGWWLILIWGIVRTFFLYRSSPEHFRFDFQSLLFNVATAGLTVWIVTYFMP